MAKEPIPQIDLIDGRPGKEHIVCRYIVKNGKKIYPKKSKVFSFWVDRNK